MAKKTKWLSLLLAGAVVGGFLLKKRTGTKLTNRVVPKPQLQFANQQNVVMDTTKTQNLSSITDQEPTPVPVIKDY